MFFLRTLKSLAKVGIATAFSLLLVNESNAQHSVARMWNEALLQSIREDYARPTVHARNLFHTSVVLYDAWAVYDSICQTYFLGKTVNGYTCPFVGIEEPTDIKAAQEEAMSYAAFRLLSHRFANSPGAASAKIRFELLMQSLGYDKANTSIDYSSGSPAALGNYLAQVLINYGYQDRSNEIDDYENQFYNPVNQPLIPQLPGNEKLDDPNRWQQLALDTFIDQSGHIIPGATPDFLGAEWGAVYPFALADSDLTMYNRHAADYWVYHDPGDPPYLDTNTVGGLSEEYKWNFGLVAIWSSHLSSQDTTLWDISPASKGNNSNYPTNFTDFDNFYREFIGGDIGTGRSMNPVTGAPYTPQMVKRGDYTRVLAEFWADGPDSETPPGHWFTLLNYVNDHPQLEKKFKGEGPVLDDLEWDVKSYFCLAGAMHDAAVTAWGVKGWYDYIRPISAIRYMAGLGQSSDTALPSYHPGGIHLKPGYIELVQLGDTLAGDSNQHVGKVKLYAWKGPEYINDPKMDEAGVDWILAENWWPYQRPTFITPPFAGYVSGHSTYSRAAAEVLTLLTGTEYFPGGMGEFLAEKNKFLVFEEGPSEDIRLQWATYRDASDQCSLSRIWGGIHPPADDVPGRLMGIEVGEDAFYLAETYFQRSFIGIEDKDNEAALHSEVYPNPVANALHIRFEIPRGQVSIAALDMNGRFIAEQQANVTEVNQVVALETEGWTKGVYVVRITTRGGEIEMHRVVKY